MLQFLLWIEANHRLKKYCVRKRLVLPLKGTSEPRSSKGTLLRWSENKLRGGLTHRQLAVCATHLSASLSAAFPTT
jgi:hypothetical protein